jgi:hypothetical protein
MEAKDVTNCGECEHGELKKEYMDTAYINANISHSREHFKCLEGVKDDVVCCPHFKQKTQ